MKLTKLSFVVMTACLANLSTSCGKDRGTVTVVTRDVDPNSYGGGGTAAPGGGTGDVIAPPSLPGGSAAGAPAPETLDVSVVSVVAKNEAGSAPRKGDNNLLQIVLKNAGNKPGTVKVTPYLTSTRFADYQNVKLPTVDVPVVGGENKTVPIKLENFFQDAATKKQYALNRGAYTVRFEVESEGVAKKEFQGISGSAFTIEKSNVMLNGVFATPDYAKQKNYNGTMQKYLDDLFSEKMDVVDSTNKVVSYPLGFNEATKTLQRFRIFEVTPVTGADENVKNAAINAGISQVLGTTVAPPESCNELTGLQNHGFDILYSFNSGMPVAIAGQCGSTVVVGTAEEGDPSVIKSKQMSLWSLAITLGATGACHNYSNVTNCFAYDSNKLTADGRWILAAETVAAMTRLRSENP